jgi:phosphate transport system protein
MERAHLSRQFDIELDVIRGKLLEMGGKVEWMIANSIQSLIERDSELAEQTIAFDHEINRLEIEIDRDCLEILALRQPAARDLRFITLAIKIVTDLERIGDLCANVSKRVKELNQEPPLKPLKDMSWMAQAVSTMVNEALEAFVRGDEDLAKKVCKEDQAVDNLYVQIQRELLTSMLADPATISRAIKVSHIAKCLERIADHATNLAEMVIFMVKGRISGTAPSERPCFAPDLPESLVQ